METHAVLLRPQPDGAQLWRSLCQACDQDGDLSERAVQCMTRGFILKTFSGNRFRQETQWLSISTHTGIHMLPSWSRSTTQRRSEIVNGVDIGRHANNKWWRRLVISSQKQSSRVCCFTWLDRFMDAGILSTSWRNTIAVGLKVPLPCQSACGTWACHQTRMCSVEDRIVGILLWVVSKSMKPLETRWIRACWVLYMAVTGVHIGYHGGNVLYLAVMDDNDWYDVLTSSNDSQSTRRLTCGREFGTLDCMALGGPGDPFARVSAGWSEKENPSECARGKWRKSSCSDSNDTTFLGEVCI